jgi:hypothetical protein
MRKLSYKSGYRVRFLLLIIPFIFGIIFSVKAQTNVWTDIPVTALSARTAGDITPVNFRAVALNQDDLRSFMQSVPKETNISVRNSNRVLSLPMPDGSFRNFKIVESPVMEQGLADKFPDIRTFSGQATDDATITARLDWTMWGFHAILITPGGFIFIEPNLRGNTGQYIVYNLKDLPIPADQKFCSMESEVKKLAGKIPPANLASGTQLRTYRLAVAATGEYTALNGGTVASALAAMTTLVNQIDAIYEREVAIRFVLIANNNLIIYTDATTDPFSNTAGNPCSTPIRSENQTAIDGAIGSANYDIGHVFIGTNTGGCAAGSVICGASKAWGASGVRFGSAFDIGLASHEIGHQFSAQHTFNSSIGSCSGGQYAPSAAYEPGSGTTIMSYAGSCHDIQGFRDMLFHTFSYQEIVTFSTLGGGNACPVITNTGNAAPTVSAGGSGFTIPISTPFQLTGSGNDADGDPLTYSWEEFDLGPQGDPDLPAGTAPIFRSFPPVSSTSRTFPQLSDLLNNTQTTGEILPSYGRALNFRLTARDNRPTGGGVEYASMSMTVDGGSGPFLVTSPNTAVNWCPGAHTVTWNVAGTDVAPVSASNVKISLSTDGGNTYPVVLAASTPNDGSQSINIPCTYSTMARIKLEAVGNVFFDISNTNFTVGDNTNPTFTVPEDITINKDENCNYDANIETTGDVTDEADNCDNSLDAVFADLESPGSCDGETILTRTWTLTDDCGNSTVKVQTITVTDITAPTFTQPDDITIYKDGECNHDASVAVTGDVTDEADNCDNSLNAVFSDVTVPGSCIGEEIITRTWSLTDDCGNNTTHDQVITVKDTTRPSIENIVPNPAVLWPPTHKMVNVTINYTAVDNCSPVTNSLAVTSNEPINGTGDGDTSPDWIILDDHNLQLRAERAGNGTGRIYTITITSTDDCGNVATATTQVLVPHNQTSLVGDVITIAEKGHATDGLNIQASPNPSRGNFKILVSSINTVDKIAIQVVDMFGRVTEVRNSLLPNQVIYLGNDYKPGEYIVRFSQGTNHKEIKLIKLPQ